MEVSMDALGIIRQIETDPALKAQMRAVLLGDELLALPAQVAQIVEGQREMQAAIRDLTESQKQTIVSQDRMEKDLSQINGFMLEHQVRCRVRKYLPDEIERARVLTDDDLDSLLETLNRKKPLTSDERTRINRTDVIARARVGKDPVTIVAEVSVLLYLEDVTRAAEAARILRERGQRARPFAIGEAVADNSVSDLADRHGVEICLGL